MSDFKVGDLVKLKSGDTKMTIVKLDDYSPSGPSNGVCCEWLEKGKRREEVFYSTSLEAVTEENDLIKGILDLAKQAKPPHEGDSQG